MPPKRKRNAESDTQSIAPSTRSTRASTRATTASEANNEVVAAKKPRTTRKASTKKPAVSQSSEDEPNGDVEASPKKRRGKTATVTKNAANKKSAAPSKPVDPLQPGTYTKERALELFKKYAENEDDVEPGAEPNISPDGVMSLYQDANVSLEGVQPLIFSWICKSNAMGSIKQNEWMEGMGTLQVDTVEKLSMALNDIENQLYQRGSVVGPNDNPEDPYRKAKLREIHAGPEEAFRDFYFSAFSLGRIGTNRNIDIDTALAFWNAILKPKFPHITDFTDYITEMNKNEAAKMYKAVTKDLWRMLYRFLQDVQPDFSDYNADSEWPSAIDAYVDWKKTQEK